MAGVPANRKTFSEWQKEFPMITARRFRHRGTNQIHVVFRLVCPMCKRPGWVRPNCLRRQKRDGIPLGRCGVCAQDKGGWITSTGYHLVRYRGRTTPRARVVLAKKLGRPLLKREEAHHLNLNRGDDRPENLEPKLKSEHGRGITPSDAAKWLRSIPGWIISFSPPELPNDRPVE
jgi:hypothetical protein